MLLMLAACGPREEVSLIDLEAFEIVSGASDDPYRDHFTDQTCEPVATGFELFGGEASYGIDSDRCMYVTIAQPAATHVDEGDLLHVRMWHFELEAAAPATATVALALDGTTVWERFLEIPGPSGLDVPYFDAPTDVPEGATVAFHVRNHGRNSYSLLEITVGGERPE